MAEVDIDQIREVMDPGLANDVAKSMSQELGLSNMTYYDFLPPSVISSIEGLILLLKIVSVVFIVYFLIRILKTLYDVGTSKKIRKTNTTVDQINDKLDILINSMAKNDKKLRDHLDEINKVFKRNVVHELPIKRPLEKELSKRKSDEHLKTKTR